MTEPDSRVMVAPSGYAVVYVAGREGVYQTDGDGATWNELSNQDPLSTT